MATLTVSNSNDNGAGSLRAAIASAKAGDTIKFSSTLAGKTITLTSGQLLINKNLTIDATGASGLTLSGNYASRVIDVQPYLNVTLRGLTLINGKTNGVGVDGAGGGLRTGWGTTLRLENSVVRNNFANGEGGGGLWLESGSNNTIVNSRFENNNTNGYGAVNSVGERGGGAIGVASNSILNVSGSTFTGNKGINGGAINTVLSTLNVSNSNFYSNDTTKGGQFGPHTRGYGGAIYADGGRNGISDTISITGSRFDRNKAAGQGGALFLYAYPGHDSITLSNSTVIYNYIAKDTQNISLGGGIRVGGGGSFTMTNTTVAKNRALDQAGGLWTGEGSPISINNSTFYGNSAKSFDGKWGLGGAMLLSSNPTTSIVNSTIADNYAGFQGGAFWGGGSNTTLRDTLVTLNQAYNGGNNWNLYHNTGTTFRNGGGNVEYNPYNTNDTKIVPGVTIANPQLAAFVDNGTALQSPPQPGNPLVTAGADPVSGARLSSTSFLAAMAESDAIAASNVAPQSELEAADSPSAPVEELAPAVPILEEGLPASNEASLPSPVEELAPAVPILEEGLPASNEASLPSPVEELAPAVPILEEGLPASNEASLPSPVEELAPAVPILEEGLPASNGASLPSPVEELAPAVPILEEGLPASNGASLPSPVEEPAPAISTPTTEERPLEPVLEVEVPALLGRAQALRERFLAGSLMSSERLSQRYAIDELNGPIRAIDSILAKGDRLLQNDKFTAPLAPEAIAAVEAWIEDLPQLVETVLPNLTGGILNASDSAALSTLLGDNPLASELLQSSFTASYSNSTQNANLL